MNSSYNIKPSRLVIIYNLDKLSMIRTKIAFYSCQKSLFSLLLILCFSLGGLFAQNSKLAQQYYQNGEYEKAAATYVDLYKSNPNNSHYFSRYVDCLMKLENFEEAEAVVRKEIKNSPKKVQLYVTYGNIFERQFREEEAKEQYEKGIKKLTADRFGITNLANGFIGLKKYELAIQTYKRGMELLKDENLFAYNLGDLYSRKGDKELMIQYYLQSLKSSPGRINALKSIFQRKLEDEDDYLELQTQLYEAIQEDSDLVEYPELLTWMFVQQKDYKNAFRQVKALDSKLRENGGRIYKLADIAYNAKDYDAAIEAYDYIVSEKGNESTFYLDAKRQSLRAKRNLLTDGYDYTEDDLKNLELQYETFLEEFGRTKTTASIILELADLEAFYLNDFDKAISLLQALVDYPNMNPRTLAQGKLSLADFYLMKGERWEATLLYAQVDKAFKDDALGHEARYRNAKLSYYMADYEWAQAQFKVLKASTSKLISNDAIDISVFITDNLGLDTTTTVMELYSNAELLIFQNRFEDAFAKLDTIKNEYSDHTLVDDVLYSEGKIHLKKRDYVKAAEKFQTIVDNHIEEIRADNALFNLAELYENQLNDKQKAKELYERLFIDMSNSTFAVEARKRYRALRGDEI